MVKQEKWTDPRTPVSVEWIGPYKVTIYDMEKYEESLRQYPDEPNNQVSRLVPNDKPAFAKQKPASRYNWITPLDQPLKGHTP